MQLDIERFWKDDAAAHEDNCFSPGSPQVALGIAMSDECVFAELGVEGNPWLEIPRALRLEYNKRYNDIAEKTVGRRLLREELPEEDAALPAIRGIGEVFGGKYVPHEGTMWLMGSCATPAELEAVLDRADRTDIRSFILPDNWESEKKRVYEAYGTRPSLWRGVRGPVTLATSIYGAENLIYLILDAPELAKRFSASICRVICEMAEAMDAEAGYAPGAAPGGFYFADDNCCLLNPGMYELFGYPVLKAVFERFSPNPGDNRYQHSDSNMAHLLPILSRLNFTGINFGPTVLADEIRRHMPRTRIDGCLSPMTFMRNDEAAIVAEVRRDCEMARESRGLNLSTAGSINNGSLLSSMRLVMETIQQYGRY